MTPPRLLYMGYGAVGCFCLEELLAAGFEVVGVLCRAGDRAEKPESASSVFTRARQAGLHCFATTDSNDPGFVAEARDLEPDLLLSVQYDRILKPPLLAVPRHGAFNLHFGPLPRLRGCFPTKWAILDDEPAGVTFHCIDPGIDSGDVIARAVLPLAPDETDSTLYHRLEEAGKALFREQIGWMLPLRQPPRTPQRDEEASYHPKRMPFDGVIDWTRGVDWVERFLRAMTFPPYPAAKTWYEGEELQIRAPVAIDRSRPDLPPGGFVLREQGEIAVSCGDGWLRVREVLRGGEAIPVSALASPSGRFTSEAP